MQNHSSTNHPIKDNLSRPRPTDPTSPHLSYLNLAHKRHTLLPAHRRLPLSPSPRSRSRPPLAPLLSLRLCRRRLPAQSSSPSASPSSAAGRTKAEAATGAWANNAADDVQPGSCTPVSLASVASFTSTPPQPSMAWRRRSAAPQSSSSSASSPPPRAPISSSPGGSEGCFMLVGTDKNTSRINTIGKESWSKMLARSLSLKSCWLFPTYGEADDQVRTCTATGRCSYGAVLLKVLTVRVLVDGFMGPVSSAATMWFVH